MGKTYRTGLPRWHFRGTLLRDTFTNENFREGVPVIINLSQMSDADARRLIDFASGLSLGLYGRIERVTSKVFLLSPENIAVSGHGGIASADPESAGFDQS